MTNLTNDALAMWKESEVTARFLSDIAQQLKEVISECSQGSTIEQIAIGAIRRDEAITILENVLYWKPQELLHD